MRRHTWMGLGVAAVGMVVVLGAEPGRAQAPATYPSASPGGYSGADISQGASSSGMMQGTGGSGDLGQTTDTSQTMSQDSGTQMSSQMAAAQQQVEVARLRTQVAQLQQQLARMRTQLAQAQSGGASSSQMSSTSSQQMSSQPGVGGSGAEGTSSGEGSSSASQNSSAPQESSAVGYTPESSAVGYSTGTGGGGAVDAPGYALANVLHTGRVRSVSSGQLVIDEEGGGSFTLTLSSNVRVLRGGRSASLQSLEKGMRVKTSADLYAQGNPVTRIEVLSSK